MNSNILSRPGLHLQKTFTAARYHDSYRLENAWYLKEKMVKHWEYIGETPTQDLHTPILLFTHPCLTFSHAYVFVRHVPFRDASEMRLSMAHVMWCKLCVFHTHIHIFWFAFLSCQNHPKSTSSSCSILFVQSPKQLSYRPSPSSPKIPKKWLLRHIPIQFPKENSANSAKTKALWSSFDQNLLRPLAAVLAHRLGPKELSELPKQMATERRIWRGRTPEKRLGMRWTKGENAQTGGKNVEKWTKMAISEYFRIWFQNISDYALYDSEQMGSDEKGIEGTVGFRTWCHAIYHYSWWLNMFFIIWRM